MNRRINKYVDIYINNYIKPFRGLITSKYTINISGLLGFIAGEDQEVALLINMLQSYGFTVIISNDQDSIANIQVEYVNEDDGVCDFFEYRIENLMSTITLSSKTGISVVGILIMQIVSRLICKFKIMYKAIILDLDDTIWKGTLIEDGIESIKQNLNSNDAIPFIAFMRFISAVAKELGVYVAICSRNNIDDVLSAIDSLGETEFPIKEQIDCVVANYNDKSSNIKAIAQQLSILTDACVFVDDNQLVRDEVKQNLPEVFVPEWRSHDELITLFTACCIFDRFELSLKSRNRKHLYQVLQQERKRNYMPQLFVKISDDIGHKEANCLYAKSNQFKFAVKNVYSRDCSSLMFELYRDNGENLGVCSALTFIENKNEIHIINWAISCRYFEIGLEEYILLYIFSLSNGRAITFTFNDTGCNGRTVALMKKYKNSFRRIGDGDIVSLIRDEQLMKDIQHNTNLKDYCDD